MEMQLYLQHGGELKNENSEAYEESYLKSQDFVNILNENAKKLNEERKDNENFIELSEWELSPDNGYPVLIKNKAE